MRRDHRPPSRHRLLTKERNHIPDIEHLHGLRYGIILGKKVTRSHEMPWAWVPALHRKEPVAQMPQFIGNRCRENPHPQVRPFLPPGLQRIQRLPLVPLLRV